MSRRPAHGDDGAGALGRAPAEDAPARSAGGMRLACAGVSFSYSEGDTPVRALREVTFAVEPGGSLALLGASGSGKTTLLQVVRGLDEADSGEVVLDGASRGAPGFAALRREVGLVFQRPELQLFASTARDDVAFGPRRLGWTDDDVRAAVDQAMELVGLPARDYADRHPYTLSGGEQRRLALAGVLAMRPRLLLLDEPFVSLDPATRRDLAALLRRLKAGGATIVLATHDVDLAWSLCDHVLILDGGCVAAAGDWDFSDAGGRLLARNRLRQPFLVELWRRLGRDPQAAPRTADLAAEALTNGALP